MAIKNVHLLEEVYGRFPSFHDAEVLKIVMRRESEMLLPTLEAQIHVFEMTSQVKDGAYVLIKHNLVTFQFSEIDELKLDGFNNQNVLQALNIVDISHHQLEHLKFEVTFEGIFGVHATFRCSSVEVIGVVPISNSGIY